MDAVCCCQPPRYKLGQRKMEKDWSSQRVRLCYKYEDTELRERKETANHIDYKWSGQNLNLYFYPFHDSIRIN